MSETLRQYSKLRSDQRTPLRELLPLDAPFSLQLDPSNRCNFHCSFCPRALPDYRHYVEKDVHFDFDLYARLVDEFRRWTRLKVLRFYYLGEPLLNPRFADMLELAVREKIAERIEITSNASVLSEKLAERICDAVKGRDTDVYFRFSVYSVVSQRHLLITRSSFDVEKINENIAGLKRIRDANHCSNLFLYAKMLDTFTDENEMFLERYRPICDEAAIERPHNWSGFDGNNVLADTYGNVLDSAPRTFRHQACPLLFYSMAVNADGSVVVCCIDWSRKTLLGNVNTNSLREIWHGEPLRNLRCLHLAKNRHANEACRNCEFLHEVPEADNVDMISPEQWLEMENGAGVRSAEIRNAGVRSAGVPAK